MLAATPYRPTRPRRRRMLALVGTALGAALLVGACSLGPVSDAAARGPFDGQDGDGPGAGHRGDGTAGGEGIESDGGGYGRGGQVATDPGWGAGDEGSDPTSPSVDLAASTLTSDEVDALQQMREEEKLAHDVYVALGGAWGSRIFENIARAETAHGSAVATLLDRYGIADPTADQLPGAFTDPGLQALYDDLVARGRSSLADALTVGALIEDLDIHDLRELATDTPDIARVFEALEQGSENHLRAFVRNLERAGASYAPTYLSADELESIIGSADEPGQAG